MISTDKYKAASVAVIILNFDKRDFTLDCLQSVCQQDYPSFDVVVVDNGSSDGSADAVAERFPKVHLVRSPVNLGASGGRNLGIQHAAGRFQSEYFLFLDNDTIIQKNCLGRLVAELSRDVKAGMACPKAYQDLAGNRIMSAGICVNFSTGAVYDRGSGETDRGQFDQIQTVSACGAFGFLVRAKLLKRLNGFDDMFNPYGWEDVDICLRAKRLGFHTLYVPLATLVHRGGRVGRGIVQSYERFKARNFIYLIRRHGTFIEQVAFLITGPVKGFQLILRELLKGNNNLIKPIGLGVWEAVTGRKNVPKR
jgi:GT2 family glycosyltransferase